MPFIPVRDIDIYYETAGTGPRLLYISGTGGHSYPFHELVDLTPEEMNAVFIAGGRYDGVAPAENLRAIQWQIEGAQLEFIQGGHDFYDHDPMAYRRIGEFLQGKLDDR